MPSLQLTPDLFTWLSFISTHIYSNTGLEAFDKLPERWSSFPYVTLTSSPKGSFLFALALISVLSSCTPRFCYWPFLYQRITCYQFEPDLVGFTMQWQSFSPLPSLLFSSHLLFKRNCTPPPHVSYFHGLSVLICTCVPTLGIKKAEVVRGQGPGKVFCKRFKNCGSGLNVFTTAFISFTQVWNCMQIIFSWTQPLKTNDFRFC